MDDDPLLGDIERLLKRRLPVLDVPLLASSEPADAARAGGSFVDRAAQQHAPSRAGDSGRHAPRQGEHAPRHAPARASGAAPGRNDGAPTRSEDFARPRDGAAPRGGKLPWWRRPRPARRGGGTSQN